MEEQKKIDLADSSRVNLIQGEQTPKISWSFFPTKEEALKIIKDNYLMFQDIISWLKKQPTALGIASNQLSYEGKRIELPFCFSKGVQGNWHFWLNPVIVKYYGEPTLKFEGCLTWPNNSIKANRYVKIDIQYIDVNGILKEKTSIQLEAQIIQHEFDHLQGIPEVLIERLKNIRVGEKMQRNNPCNCGSGKKYKVCCGKLIS